MDITKDDFDSLMAALEKYLAGGEPDKQTCLPGFYSFGNWRKLLRLARLGAAVEAALQETHDEGEAQAEKWHAAQEHGYIPGYFNALIDVARRLGFAFYRDKETGKDKVRLRRTPPNTAHGDRNDAG